VVAKVRERLAVSKQVAQKFDGERFNLRKLNELYVKKQYETEITNMFNGVPRNFFRVGGCSTNSVEYRENGDLGTVAP
jgi:hypothetical protein